MYYFHDYNKVTKSLLALISFFLSLSLSLFLSFYKNYEKVSSSL